MRITRRRGMTLSILELALLIGVTVFLLTGAWAANTQGELADRVVRLHVIANSDAGGGSGAEAAGPGCGAGAGPRRSCGRRRTGRRRSPRLAAALPELERLAEETVAASGFDYGVTAELAETSFPHKGLRRIFPARREVPGPAARHRAGDRAELVVRGVPAPVHRCRVGGAGDGPGRRSDGGPGVPDDRGGRRLCAEIQGGGVVGGALAEAGEMTAPGKRASGRPVSGLPLCIFWCGEAQSKNLPLKKFSLPSFLAVSRKITLPSGQTRSLV